MAAGESPASSTPEFGIASSADLDTSTNKNFGLGLTMVVTSQPETGLSCEDFSQISTEALTAFES